MSYKKCQIIQVRAIPDFLLHSKKTATHKPVLRAWAVFSHQPFSAKSFAKLLVLHLQNHLYKFPLFWTFRLNFAFSIQIVSPFFLQKVVNFAQTILKFCLFGQTLSGCTHCSKILFLQLISRNPVAKFRSSLLWLQVVWKATTLPKCFILFSRIGVTPIFPAPDPVFPATGNPNIEALLLGPNPPTGSSFKPEMLRPAPPLYLVSQAWAAISVLENFQCGNKTYKWNEPSFLAQTEPLSVEPGQAWALYLLNFEFTSWTCFRACLDQAHPAHYAFFTVSLNLGQELQDRA